MNLHVIEAGYFKLDGGAMYGVVPKVIWSKIHQPDDKNLVTWAMRCLLVEDGDRLTLIDCGLGDKQSEKFFSYYEPHGDTNLEVALGKKGFHPDDVTDVIMTHLHFDHCGGAVNMIGENQYRPAFKNATYWSHQDHWQWAMNPNPRERASFLKENFTPIEEAGQLKFVEEGKEIVPGITFETADGHTEAQIIPHIHYKDQEIVYCADLLPSPGHIPLAYVMGYDVRPLVTMKEKKAFLDRAYENNYVLYFEHDAEIECGTLKMTEKGARKKDTFPLSEIL